MNESLQSLACTVAALRLHPVKSCAGIEVREALIIETGLEFDREWMVVDAGGAMLTQRDEPRLALVQPSLRHADLVLRAPGMLALHLRLDSVEAPTRVQVCDDIVKAYDMGAIAAQWFSDFLQRPVRLVRFDPEETRLSDRAWTGTAEARNAFSDGFPLLLANAASLAALNARIANGARADADAVAGERSAVTMARFRPNIVLDGLAPFEEDHVGHVVIETDGGAVTLRLVKPCVRCEIPNIDPLSAASGVEPMATLAQFRSDPQMKGGITFAVNAIVESGLEQTLRVGQSARAHWRSV